MYKRQAHDVPGGLLVGFQALGGREDDAVRGDAEVAGLLFHVHHVGEAAAREEGHVDLGILSLIHI